MNQTIEVRCPATDQRVGAVPVEERRQVEAVAANLREAQAGWQERPARERGRQLLLWLGWMLDHERELLEILQAESGKSWGDASLEMLAAIEMIGYHARRGPKFLREQRVRPHSLASGTKRLRLVYEPHPLVGVITPWNYPLAMPLLDVPAALVAGAAVLSKPSEFTPLCWRRVVSAWEEIGNDPVLACVTGGRETGEAVVDVADFVMFTGSTATGRKIASRAADRLIPVSLELGGKDPMIVLADADLDRAAAAAVWGGLANSGQTCVAVERVYVEESVHDAFVERVSERLGALRQGMDRPGSFSCDLGAMATAAQKSLVRDHLDDALARGATARDGGVALDVADQRDGLFQRPVLLTGVDHSMRCMREETFGPLLPVMAVADESQAVALANDSIYGLTASVFTGDRLRGERVAGQLQAGAVNVNNVMSNLFQLPLPFGGWKQSGVGSRFGGPDSVRKYCRRKAIVAERVVMPTEIYWYPHGRLRGRFQRRAVRLLGAPGLRRRLFG